MRLKWILLCITVLHLCACGGGGDSGGGGPARGGFSLSATSVSFSALEEGSLPPTQSISMTLTDSATAAVGAAFPAGQVPSWLSVNIVGSAPNYTIQLNTNTFVAPGSYSATVLVGTADQTGTILQNRSIAVSFVVSPAIKLTAANKTVSFVFGSSTTTATLPLSVQAPGITWTIASSAPWITVPSGTHTGSADLTLNVNASTLFPVDVSGIVTVINTSNPLDRRSITYVAQVAAPTITTSMGSIVLGGIDGVGSFVQAMEVSLNTGDNTYPWTLTMADTQSLAWMTSTAASGTLGGAQHAKFDLGFDRQRLPNGPAQYTGTATFGVTVKGMTFNSIVPVTLNFETHRLFVLNDGVAFSSFPTRKVLTRTLTVSESRGWTGVAWTASSNQSWLTVTPSGITDGPLTLTADPTGLAVDSFYSAEVTLASNDRLIERSEKMRIGLWVGSSDPVNIDKVAGYWTMAVNPVEPYLYAADITGPLNAYNIYTGAKISGFTAPSITTVAAITISSDGSKLYVHDQTATGQRIVTLNPATGAFIAATDEYRSLMATAAPRGLQFARPNGHPILWTPWEDIYDLEKNTELKVTSGGISVGLQLGTRTLKATTLDGLQIFKTSDVSTSDYIGRGLQRFTVLGQRSLETQGFINNNTLIFNGGQQSQFCASADSKKLFVASSVGSSAVLNTYSLGANGTSALPDTPTGSTFPIGVLTCAWDNRVYVGLTTVTAPQNNLLIFDAASGSLLGSTLKGDVNGYGYPRLEISGDRTRVMSAYGLVTGGNVEFYISFYNLP